MKDFFIDIFEYHHFFNEKLIIEFKTHKSEIPPSTYALFCHCLNAHQIWNSRILETKSLAVHQIHTLEKCKELDDQNYNDSLDILSDFDLSKKISYKISGGIEFENSIQQILFHIANHFTHHRGQIISDLRQNGIEPIITDYIFYKR